MFVEHQISILDWFLEGSCDTEDWKFSFAITGINNILKYIKIKQLFYIVIVFHNITFIVFFNKYI